MKSIGINELVEQEKGPIWVVNASNELYVGGADVFVTIVNNGQPTVFSVPRTWLPVEMTTRFPRKVILESTYFIEALAKGLLRAVSAETAQKLLGQPGVEQEQARLKEQEDAVKAANQARGIGKNVLISTGDTERDEEMETEFANRTKSATNAFVKASIGNSVNMDDDEEGGGEEVEEVSAGFRGWVNKVNLMEDAGDARNEVKLRGDMSIAEATYLMKACLHTNISSALAKKLKALADA